LLIKVYHELLYKKEKPCELTEERAIELRKALLDAEFTVLKEINFELEIELPYHYIEEYKYILKNKMCSIDG